MEEAAPGMFIDTRPTTERNDIVLSIPQRQDREQELNFYWKINYSKTLSARFAEIRVKSVFFAEFENFLIVDQVSIDI